MITPSNRRRGALLYGVAGVLVMTGALVGVVLDRSLDSYRRSVQLEARLRSTAAIEGAARVLNPAIDTVPASLDLTGTRVVFGAPTVEGPRLMIPATAEVRAVNDRVVYTSTQVIEFRATESGTWTLLGVTR
jgi:hypothetical protein